MFCGDEVPRLSGEAGDDRPLVEHEEVVVAKIESEPRFCEEAHEPLCREPLDGGIAWRVRAVELLPALHQPLDARCPEGLPLEDSHERLGFVVGQKFQPRHRTGVVEECLGARVVLLERSQERRRHCFSKSATTTANARTQAMAMAMAT